MVLYRRDRRVRGELLKIGGEFWTADERLYNAVRGAFPAIRWLGEMLEI